MTATNPRFVLEDQPEVFASDARTSVAAHRAVEAGRARRIARGLYTRNVDEPIESVVRRNWAAIAAIYGPGGVVVDRSAFEAKPSSDGSLMLDGGPQLKSRRSRDLPGLKLRVRPGPGPLNGDMPHMNGLFFSSRARAWLDNLVASRSRGGVSRTLSRAELEVGLNRLVAVRGWETVNELRDQARELAKIMDADAQFVAFDDLVGALQGTRDAPLSTPSAKAAHAGRAFDAARLELFGRLHAALSVEQFPGRPEQRGSLPALSFIEAYFSNWIEGTEFELREAEAIVFDRAIPENRFEDAHDILGTFDLVNHESRRAQLPHSGDELIGLIRSHHASMLERRPEARPGQFKHQENRTGATTFVHPDLVDGTLREGFRYFDSLPEGLPRAIFLQFLIADVHPFTDGNGRVARVLMNAALTAVGQQRIVIPLVFRENYLQALRALTRNGDAAPLISVLDFAQRYASEIPWRSLEGAEVVLRATNAFVTPEEAERTGVRLRLPALQVDQASADELATPAPAALRLREARQAASGWASEHVDELTLIWDRFHKSGEWPDATLLQRELFGAGQNFDASAFARSIPPQLGRLDVQSGRLVLTPRGLAYVERARPLLANIPMLVRLAVDRYGDPAVEPRISSSEFESLLHATPAQARELSELLLLDSWLFRAAGNDERGAKQFQIDDPAILRVRNVNTLEDYFAAQDGLT